MSLPKKPARKKLLDLSDKFGLPIDPDTLVTNLSVSEKQRLEILKTLYRDCKLLILDEPTAALDVSIQAIVLNLLVKIRAELGVTMLFVSHDLHVVRLLCDRTIVMQKGSIVEQGETENLMTSPVHAYTRMLLDAVPEPPVLNEAIDMCDARGRPDDVLRGD